VIGIFVYENFLAQFGTCFLPYSLTVPVCEYSWQVFHGSSFIKKRAVAMDIRRRYSEFASLWLCTRLSEVIKQGKTSCTHRTCFDRVMLVLFLNGNTRAVGVQREIIEVLASILRSPEPRR